MAAETVIQGYRLRIDQEFNCMVENSKGKQLQSIPAKVRKDPLWAQWQAVRKIAAQRKHANRQQVEEWMVAGDQVAGELLLELYRDPSWRAALNNLLVRGERVMGFLINADQDKGLGVLQENGDSVWVAPEPLQILHPCYLSADELQHWQELLRDFELQQGIEQLLRQVVQPDVKECKDLGTERYTGIDLRSTISIQYALNAHGWSATAGLSRRRFIVRRPDDAPLAVTACWNYAGKYWDYGDAPSECTSGEVYFYGPDSTRIPLEQVPAAVFSEACRTVAEVIRKQRIGE